MVKLSIQDELTDSIRDSYLKNSEGEPVAFQPVFLKVLLEGTLSLYIYEIQLFTQKEEGPVYILRQYYQSIREEYRTVSRKRNEFMGVLSNLTYDCPTVNARVASTRMSIPSIMKIVKAYNKCVHSDYYLPSGNSSWIKLNPGIATFIGPSTLILKPNQLNFEGEENITQTVTSFTPGLALDIDFPWSKTNLSLSTGLFYYSANFDNLVFQHGESTSRKEVLTFDQAYIKIPFRIKYSPWNFKWKLSFVAGVSVNFYTKEDFTYSIYSYQPETDDFLQMLSTNDFSLSKPPSYGALAGLNLRKEMGKSGYINTGIHYERTWHNFWFTYAYQESMPFLINPAFDYLSFYLGYHFYLW